MEILQKIVDYYTSLSSTMRTILTVLFVSLITLFIFFIMYKIWKVFIKITEKTQLEARAEFSEKQNKKKLKELQKEREKHSSIYLGNPWLEGILKAFNVIIFGGLGAGKTLFANVLVHYLNMKYEKEDKKSYRRYKYTNPDYLKELKKLKENKSLRIYANMALEDNDGNKAQDLWPALFQEKRVIENGIFLTDEFGEKLGKDLWQIQQSAKDPRIERATNTARYARQIKNIKWIGTEQSHDNIFKPIRDKGFLEVQAQRTYVWISKRGKFKRFWGIWGKRILPGYFTTDVVSEFRKSFFISDKIKTALKLLVTTWWKLPQTYYRDVAKFVGKIKHKYTNFQIIISVGNYERMFKFTNEQIFKYNTRAAKYRYDEQFDKDGNRLWQVN